jgi:uncharacterized phage protein gp47/JayE
MQIDYTSRDFESLKADLIDLIKDRTNSDWDPTDYSDLGYVLVEAFSYMGDIMSHYLDRIANEVSIDTAIQRKTLLSLAKLYDYKPSGPTPAEISILFTNVGLESIDIPLKTQVLAPLSYGPYSTVYFETTDSATALAPEASITLTAKEGKTVNTDRPDLIDSTYNKALPANLGTSSGSQSQSFLIVESGVIDDSIAVYVGQGAAFSIWSYADSLLEYGPTSTVFTTERNENGTLNVIFGDGVNGSIPPAGQLISATYKTSVGSAGNIKSLAVSELTFIPGNTDPQALTYLTVTNPAPSFGGADADNTSQLRAKIKAAVSARRRAITLEDYSNLALLVSRVGKANASSSIYSNVNLYLQSQESNEAAPGYPQVIITTAAGSGSAVTYTTEVPHGFSVGNILNISGLYLSQYNLQGVAVASVPSDTEFTVTSTVTGTWVSATANGRTGLGIKLTPTSNWYAIASAVELYMADKIPAGITLNVLPPTYVPVYINAAVSIQDTYKQSNIKLAIYKALLGTDGLFQYSNNTFGGSVPLSSVISTIQSIPGVVSTSITKYNTTDASSAADFTVSANQILYLTSSNLVSTVSGGIA